METTWGDFVARWNLKSVGTWERQNSSKDFMTSSEFIREVCFEQIEEIPNLISIFNRYGCHVAAAAAAAVPPTEFTPSKYDV